MSRIVRIALSVGFVAGLLVCSRVAHAAEAPQSLPPLATVRTTVNKVFAARRGFQMTDLASQADGDTVLKELEKLGWKPSDATRIRAAMLPEKSFLVRQSRSPEGRAFMRQVARLPQGYDRLDHLSRIPNGEPTVERLIRGPDGYKLLEYMTTASGGRELGRMLSADENGANFNDSTRRIYSAEALLQRLEQSYSTDSRSPARRSAPGR